MTAAGRATFAAALCLTLAGSALPAGARQEARGTNQQYAALVEQYRSGQPDAVVERLLADGPDQWLTTAGRVVKMGSTFLAGGAMASQFYEAASLMHAQAAFRLWASGVGKSASAHFDLARALVDRSERLAVKSPAFRERWYLATALSLTQLLQPAEAAERFADACKRVPGDVRLLTAAGWFSQHRSTLPAGPGWNLRTARIRGRWAQNEARQFLTIALEADPLAAEATLRLADLEGAMGRETQAVERLQGLLARTDLDRSLVYVAHLVLGGIHEAQGRTAEAERAYRDAIALDHVAQSARVALAQLLYLSSRGDEAADVVAHMFSAGETRDGNDPWLDYRGAYPSIGRLIFTDLVTEVQQ